MSHEKLKEAMAEFDRLLEKLQTNTRNSSRLATQQNENGAVIRELEAAASDAVIYKMVGPVLIRQNKTEALSTVNKRLEYVKGELQRCDKVDVDTRKQFQEAAQNVEALQKKLLDKQRQQKGRL
ncbi:prefoldin subunit 6 [Cyclospora cayetanensis]|uniref:Prefoldin subunit 6 n=1 Tax=Cyclospora cayetanensis TaxID=88456 RepID=A0A1D3CRM7_9EIME|nr:prefoldin subunit 6 [Cyclospora cayetanensis]